MEEFVEKILGKYRKRKDHLIPILQDVQYEQGYLSEEVIQSISEGLDVPVNRIYGVATFYDQFRFKPDPSN
jgi:NADH:ubiquinone oxidoreductase subunit E